MKFFYHYLWRNKVWLGGSMLGMGGFLTYRFVRKTHQEFLDAYKKFPPRIETRKPHPSLPLFLREQNTKYIGNLFKKNSRIKSIEPFTLMDATNWGAPVIQNCDGSSTELNSLSSDEWREFIPQLSGNISISFGHRKAFFANNPLPMTHAVLYISDEKGNHGIFGYLDHRIRNDAVNAASSRDFTLLHELTIKGDAKQATHLLQRIEDFAASRYKVLACNCYSPVISGLIEAKEIGFTVPNAYKDSLLIVIPSELNYGLGITSNHYLNAYAKRAEKRTHSFIAEWKNAATKKKQELDKFVEDKQVEIKEYFRPKAQKHG